MIAAYRTLLALVSRRSAYRATLMLLSIVPLLGATQEPTLPPPQQDCAALPSQEATACAAELDWMPLEAVPKELRNQQCRTCGGGYLDPLAEFAGAEPPDDADIEAFARRTELQGNTVKLSGGVNLSQGYRQLSGDSASLDRARRKGVLSGNITLREPGILLRGDRAEVLSDTGEAQVDGSEFVLHQQHLRGSAESLRRDDTGLLHLDGGSLSYCAPDNNDWVIRADSMELNVDEGIGIARGAKIELGGLPIIYSPWLRFPLDDRRRTGLLWPELGSDSRGGVDIAAPVYFNLAPNYDALYTPRYIQERGLGHEVRMRYLNKQLGFWSVGGNYLQDDEQYQRDFPDERSHDRWLLVAKHSGLIDQRWRSKVDYNKASDVNYLKDLDTSSLDNKRETSLLQLGSVDYLGDDWLLEMDVQQFQSLADDISNDYKKLPQITGQYRSDRVPFELEPIALAQYSNFDTDDNRVTGQRLYLEGGVGYPMLWTYGFLNPELKYRQLNYDLENQLVFDDNTPSSGAPLVSIDGGLFFERPVEIANTGIMQTLEPRLYYLYSDYEDQRDQPDFDSAELTFTYSQLFRETRFSGRDRIDDANQLSVGLTSRFIDDSNGREYLSASLGQIFYFEDRRVRLNPLDQPLQTSGSEVAAELAVTPREDLSMWGSIVWDPFSGEVNSGSVSANYVREDGSAFNAGYTFRRPLTLLDLQPDTDQVHLSAYSSPLWDSNWRAFASWTYSLEGNTSIEDMVGLEYDTCCWMVRLLHLRYFDNVQDQIPDFNNPNLERESSTQVQIVLKGMGGFGSRVTGIMEDMIRGFNEREY